MATTQQEIQVRHRQEMALGRCSQ